MQLEYFQLIDRIVDLNVGERTITVEAQVPQHSTIFEGHFPGYPIMPGVLLIEAMAQTSGWLLIALMKFERMPFLAAVKEAKMRTCDYGRQSPRWRRIKMQRHDHVRHCPLPESGTACAHGRDGQTHRLSAAGHLS